MDKALTRLLLVSHCVAGCYSPHAASAPAEEGQSSSSNESVGSSATSSGTTGVTTGDEDSEVEESSWVSTSAASDSSGGETDGPTPLCGNGDIDPGEDCDDANSVNGDGCNNDCGESGAVLQTIDFAEGSDLPEMLMGSALDYYHVAATPGGDVAVAARITSGGRDAVLVRVFESDFGQVWSDVIESAQEDHDFYNSEVDATDGFVVTCGYHGIDEVTGFIRLYADGELAWTRDWGDAGTGFYDCLLLPDGDVMAISVGGAGTDLLRFSSDDGTPLTAENMEDAQALGLALREDGLLTIAQGEPTAVVRVTQNAVLVSSQPLEEFLPYRNAAGPGSTDFLTGTLDFEQTEVRRYDDEDLVWSHSAAAIARFTIAVDSVGAVIFAGLKDDDMWIRKLSPEGDEMWTRTHAGSGGGQDMAHSVAVANDDSILVAGTEVTATGRHGWLSRYSP